MKTSQLGEMATLLPPRSSTPLARRAGRLSLFKLAPFLFILPFFYQLRYFQSRADAVRRIYEPD